MGVGIQVLGVAATQQFLKNTSNNISKAANVAIKEAGFFVEAEVKESIAGKRAEPRSVDTGQYLNSVKNVQNKPLTATIETNVEHAVPLEYGTSKMRARRHFTNTAKRNEVKVKDFVEIAVKKAT